MFDVTNCFAEFTSLFSKNYPTGKQSVISTRYETHSSNLCGVVDHITVKFFFHFLGAAKIVTLKARELSEQTN